MRSSEGNAQVSDGPAGMLRGIRVVLLERDPDVRLRLHKFINDEPSFVVAGWAASWPECAPLMQEYLPELLVAGPDHLPVEVAFPDQGFPLVLRLRGACRQCQLAVGWASCQHIRHVLSQLSHEIHLRKAGELSLLFDHYLAGITTQNYISQLKVCQSDISSELPVDRIDLIEASGNYIRIYSSHEIYDLRETISGVAAKLDPATFARIHRSYIVNLDHVVTLSRLDSASSHVVMRDGRTIPVGPNYRSDLSRALEDKLKLTA